MWCFGSDIYRKRKGKVSQSYPTLCNPMDCNLPGSSVHGILQARILEWVAIPFSRGSSNPGIKPRSSALQMYSLLSEPPGKVGAAVGSQLAVPWWRWLAVPGGWGQWSGLCHGTLVGGLLMLPGMGDSNSSLLSGPSAVADGRPYHPVGFLYFIFSFSFDFLSAILIG